jgi:hypothetical protein
VIDFDFFPFLSLTASDFSARFAEDSYVTLHFSKTSKVGASKKSGGTFCLFVIKNIWI